MEDVDKLDNIQDGFIHYQFIRLCQATRLQHINGHVQLANQNVLQQQHNHSPSTLDQMFLDPERLQPLSIFPNRGTMENRRTLC